MRIEPSQEPKRRKAKIVWKGFLIRLAIIFVVGFFSYIGFLGYKIHNLQSKILVMAPTQDQAGDPQVKGVIDTAKSLFSDDLSILRGASDGRINILLLGMGGEGHKGKYLTDTIMLVSVNPHTYESAMLSIPRDLYVEIADSNIFTKINAIYAYGKKNKQASESEAISSLKTTIKNVTGQDVHYFVALDFEGFKQVIQQVGKIGVQVEHDIYDSRYPGPNYSYETFQIDKGFHELDAETALKYARVRHTKGGDFGRAARQQQVLAATKRKAFSLGTLANPSKISSIMDTLGDHLKTDIQLAEVPAFINLANRINIHETTTKVLDAWSKDSLLGSTHIELGGVWAYALLPRARNYSQIYELSENILELEKIERKRESIEQEDAQIAVVPQNYHSPAKISSIMKKNGYDATLLSVEKHSQCSSGDAILSFAGKPKLFTLDDLADKLDMKVEYATADNEDAAKYDIMLCLSDEVIDYFEKQDQAQDKEKAEQDDQNILDEEGNVLINRK